MKLERKAWTYVIFLFSKFPQALFLYPFRLLCEFLLVSTCDELVLFSIKMVIFASLFSEFSFIYYVMFPLSLLCLFNQMLNVLWLKQGRTPQTVKCTFLPCEKMNNNKRLIEASNKNQEKQNCRRCSVFVCLSWMHYVLGLSTMRKLCLPSWHAQECWVNLIYPNIWGMVSFFTALACTFVKPIDNQ